jgi:hypothetical protein
MERGEGRERMRTGEEGDTGGVRKRGKRGK